MANGNRIAELREARGWARPALAEKMSTSPQQIERLEKGQRRLTLDWIERAAIALGVQATDIISGGDSEQPRSNATPVLMEGASVVRMRDDLPVVGTALGAPVMIDGNAIEQTFLNSGDIIGYIKRPTILNGRADAYGLYVVGDSMAPVYSPGATLIAETKRPPQIGDDVVVYLRPDPEQDDGRAARAVLVKRLVRRTAQYLELEQFTPAAIFRIPAHQVLRIDRVMTLGDLLE